DTVEVGQVIAVLGEGGGAPAADKKEEASDAKAESAESAKPAEKEAPAQEDENDEIVVATPSARKLDREKGINISDIKPTDPRGPIRRQDVENHRKSTAT